VVELCSLQQRHSEARHHCADRLPVRETRVDDPPGVVASEDPRDPHAAKRFVDAYLGTVTIAAPCCGL
jgi:hypothetical protein